MATELKKKRKFKIVHIILGIIAGVVLIPLLLFSYLFVIKPVNDVRIVSSMAKEDTNDFFSALSEQDYEKAVDYIYIYEKEDGSNTAYYIEGDREEWIERMKQLEESGIIIQGIRDVKAHSKDGCVRNIYFDVMIDANGTPMVFKGTTNPIALASEWDGVVKCPSPNSYAGIRILYHRDLSSRPEMDQAEFAISSELVRE